MFRRLFDVFLENTHIFLQLFSCHSQEWGGHPGSGRKMTEGRRERGEDGERNERKGRGRAKRERRKRKGERTRKRKKRRDMENGNNKREMEKGKERREREGNAKMESQRIEAMWRRDEGYFLMMFFAEDDCRMIVG